MTRIRMGAGDGDLPPSLEKVIYHPPKSASFGHQTRVREARSAWQKIQTFLDRHTDRRELSPHLRLSCWAPNDSTETSVAEAALKLVRDRFGRELDESYITRRWNITADDLPAAIEVALSNDRWPKQQEGPIGLYFAFAFAWKRASTGAVVPNQDWWLKSKGPASSMLGIQFHARRLFLQPIWLFPYSWDSLELRSFLGELNEDLPFRLREQYFKRAVPTKNGRYAIRRLHRGWLARNQ